MNLLEIVREASNRIGIVAPSAVVGSTDTQVRSLLSLSNQDGRALARRSDWQALQKEKTFTATATETQVGAVPADFDRMIPGTFWNRTQDRRVIGPLSPQRWQAMKSGLVTTPWDAYRLQGGAIIMSPVPDAGDSMVFEYVTNAWCASASDTSPDQTSWTADSDVPFLDDELMILGIIWRFKKARGLDYGEDLQDYEIRLASLAGHDGTMGALEMAMGDDGASVADPYVSDGSWNL